MSTQGPLGPGTGADSALHGTVAWSNPGNITADDSNYATANLVGAGVKENSIRLLKASSPFGDEKSTGATIGTIEIYYSYGSLVDLWGVAWDDTLINAVGFGFAVAYEESSFGATVSHYLKATNFGFTIPSGATILGILLEVKIFANLDVATANYGRITVAYSATQDPYCRPIVASRAVHFAEWQE